MRFRFNDGQAGRPYLRSFLILAAVTVAAPLVHVSLGYQVVGFIFLSVQLILGLFYPFGPVLFSAVLSTLLWDYFYVPPAFAFAVGTTQDAFMVLVFFLSAAVTGLLIQRLRKNQELLLEKQRSEQLYEAILNSVSHDLRTPLTTLLGSAAALNDGVTWKDTARRKDLLTEISDSGRRLDWVIEDLLGLARLNSGVMALNKEWQDPAELVRLILREAKRPLRRHPVRVKLPARLPLIELDYPLLKHALTNLLFNAANYSPAGSPIEVSAEVRRPFLLLSVQDRGPGIPPESLDRIFEKFYRVPGTRKSGTGMGLFIARSLVRAHDGELGVMNRRGGGAVFTLKLPLGEPPAGGLMGGKS